MINLEREIGCRYELTGISGTDAMGAHETGGFEDSGLRNLTSTCKKSQKECGPQELVNWTPYKGLSVPKRWGRKGDIAVTPPAGGKEVVLVWVPYHHHHQTLQQAFGSKSFIWEVILETLGGSGKEMEKKNFKGYANEQVTGRGTPGSVPLGNPRRHLPLRRGGACPSLNEDCSWDVNFLALGPCVDWARFCSQGIPLKRDRVGCWHVRELNVGDLQVGHREQARYQQPLYKGQDSSIGIFSNPNSALHWESWEVI